MIVKMKQDESCQDIEITVKYPADSAKLRRLEQLLRTVDFQIACEDNGEMRMVNAADIFYIESVDKRAYVYLEKAVYYTPQRLYQLAEQLGRHGFVQVSKSCILNIHRMESIRPLLNSRMEATLKNGERVSVNRNYVGNVKKALKGVCGE